MDSNLEHLTDLFAEVVTHVEAAQLGRRSSLLDLPYYQRKRLFEQQGSRCAVCGWPFDSQTLEHRTRGEAQPVLDGTRQPHRIGGDRATNLWILCGLCNAIKRESVHVGENGRVWIDNTVYPPRQRAIAFWAMWRAGRCEHRQCGRFPKVSKLFAVRLREWGVWNLDTCSVRCDVHVERCDVIRY